MSLTSLSSRLPNVTWLDPNRSDRERLLLFLQKHADSRGYVRFSQRQISHRLNIVGHDIAKHLWGLQKQELVTFSEKKSGSARGRQKSELRSIRLTAKAMSNGATSKKRRDELQPGGQTWNVLELLRKMDQDNDGVVRITNRVIAQQLGYEPIQVAKAATRLKRRGDVEFLIDDSDRHTTIGYRLLDRVTPTQTVEEEVLTAPEAIEERSEPAPEAPVPAPVEVAEPGTFREAIEQLIAAAEYAVSFPRGNISLDKTRASSVQKYYERGASLDKLASAVAFAKRGLTFEDALDDISSLGADAQPQGRDFEVILEGLPAIQQLLRRDTEIETAAEALTRAGFADEADRVLELAGKRSDLETEVLRLVEFARNLP